MNPPAVDLATDRALGVRTSSLGVRIGDTTLLAGLDLDVAEGEWLSIIGPNGAGKTTALRAIAGLVDYEGTVEIGGEDMRTLHRTARSRAIAVVPQNPVIPAGMTVFDYVLLGRNPHLKLLSVEGPEDLEIAHQVVTDLELDPFVNRRLSTLSGGERQRAIIGRALVQQSPILLLDEPTTALDVGHQQEVLDLVDQLHQERSLTVISTMHDLTIAGQYADRMLLLADGSPVAIGTAEEVLTEDLLSHHYAARVRVIRDEGDLIVVPEGPRRTN